MCDGAIGDYYLCVSDNLFETFIICKRDVIVTRDERDRLERDVTATMATLLLRVGVDAAAARHHRKPPEVLVRPGANLSTGQQVIELLTHFKVNELLPKGVLKSPG